VFRKTAEDIAVDSTGGTFRVYFYTVHNQPPVLMESITCRCFPVKIAEIFQLNKTSRLRYSYVSTFDVFYV
jgi:hypothetical protein